MYISERLIASFVSVTLAICLGGGYFLYAAGQDSAGYHIAAGTFVEARTVLDGTEVILNEENGKTLTLLFRNCEALEKLSAGFRVRVKYITPNGDKLGWSMRDDSDAGSGPVIC